MPPRAQPKETEQTPFDAMVQGGGQELAVPDDETELANVQRRQYLTGDVEFSSEETLRPRLRLAQGLTQEVQDGDAKPGQWVLNGHDPVDSAVLVPILIARARELRDADSEDRSMLCQSGDAITGIGEPGGACKSCSMANWKTGPGGKRVAPPCTLIYSYVAWSETHQAAVTIEFKRTSVGIAQFINTVAQHKKFGGFAITLGSRSQKGPRGNYSMPTAAVANVAPEILATAKAMILPPDAPTEE